ncbi:ribonuclease III [Candidatus Peregrinibacteria bacterium]|nr:ribonuclease III [Candidatus Peregrinibacteria bacterium]
MIKELTKILGFSLKNEALYEVAFTHKSYLNEHPSGECNERLEFLGDAVLELVVTEFLFRKYPEKPEGELTSYRSALVRGKHLAEISEELNLGKFLKLSRGEEKSGGRKKSYILANTAESLIGGIFLDRGFATAEKFILKHIIPRISEIIEKGLHRDAKSKLQEYTQDVLGITPHYQLVTEKGPDHDKLFVMAVYLGEKVIAEGEGSSKQKAELDAAENAVKKLNIDEKTKEPK